MKKTNYLLSVVMILLSIQQVCANDTIRVSPDYTNGGALNKAIEENGPNKVYLLETNGFYTLNKVLWLTRKDTIVNSPGDTIFGGSYEIVGEIPKSEADFMPVLQTGSNAVGEAFNIMIKLTADATIKNIFLANQTLDGQIGDFTIQIIDSVKLVVDNCMIDPVGLKDFLYGADSKATFGSRIYITNNTILRQGDKYSPGGGHTSRNVYADTMYWENNTIVSSDNSMFANTNSTDAEKCIKHLWFNHNTVAFHDVGILNSYVIPEAYITNNLFYDLTTYVQFHNWNASDPDFNNGQSARSLANVDTALVNGSNEALPSSRVSFWNRNSHYVSQAVRDEILSIPVKDSEENDVFVFPIIWNDDVPAYYCTDATMMQEYKDGSREAKMYNSPDFPNFIEDNTFYDINPAFEPLSISSSKSVSVDEHSASNAASALYWYKKNNLFKGGDALPSSQKSSFWDVDEWAGTSTAMYPAAWPRWNGKYTNATLLTASSAKLPLGDLNAFPEQKAIWEANKEQINAHILSLETDQLDLSSAIDDRYATNGLTIYPNPVQESILLESVQEVVNAKLYSLSGSLIKSLNVKSKSSSMDVSDLTRGIYTIRIELADGNSYCQKIIKE